MTAIERFRHAGDRHARLEPLVGKWNISMNVWDDAGVLSFQSDVIVANKSFVHDGRYIREDLSGGLSGERHEKTSLLGFNNIRNRYEYMTADNYDAVLLLYASAPGSSLDDKRIEVFAEYVHAGGGEKPSGTLVTIRTVIEIESNERHVLSNYYNSPGQHEYRFLEYVYNRST